MGTGAVGALVSRFHFDETSEAFKILTLLFFFLNLLFFAAICAATVARYYIFPELWQAMLRDPTQSLFIGTFPMGASTLINVAVTINQDYSFGGSGFLYTLWVFWWLDCALSMFIAVGMIFVMYLCRSLPVPCILTVTGTRITEQHHSLSQMSALWLLPMVTVIVASSSGGLLATALAHHASCAALTTAVSFSLLLMGLSLAIMIITMYLMRLVVHGPLHTSLIFSSFIILGPLGQGGFSMLVNAQNFTRIPFPASLSAVTIQTLCFCAAWVLWSMALMWLCIALCSTWSVLRRQSVPFSIAYWGTIFPNGVFALLTVELGEILDSPTLNYLGAIFSMSVFLLWLFVLTKTIPAIWNTSIFHCPCAFDLDEQTLSASEGHADA
ncbi:Sulfite efflux pump SSU1 [Mycena venus]|uniref:Sulfite efflux pump SSU1 n=1 Tax=Mycena venus TaxID=2733690 RepID=A0A8H7CAT7_9AGAR|nr:Sulfite efflux pump SSU1 [Mycena venus]